MVLGPRTPRRCCHLNQAWRCSSESCWQVLAHSSRSAPLWLRALAGSRARRAATRARGGDATTDRPGRAPGRRRLPVRRRRRAARRPRRPGTPWPGCCAGRPRPPRPPSGAAGARRPRRGPCAASRLRAGRAPRSRGPRPRAGRAGRACAGVRLRRRRARGRPCAARAAEHEHARLPGLPELRDLRTPSAPSGACTHGRPRHSPARSAPRARTRLRHGERWGRRRAPVAWRNVSPERPALSSRSSISTASRCISHAACAPAARPRGASPAGRPPGGAGAAAQGMH